MEGPDKFHRFVVIEFPTFEQGALASPRMNINKAAAFRRDGGGEVEIIIVDGGDATEWPVDGGEVSARASRH